MAHGSVNPSFQIRLHKRLSTINSLFDAVIYLDQVLARISEPQKKSRGSVLSNNGNDVAIKDRQFVEDHG